MDFGTHTDDYAYFEEENPGVLRFLPEGKRVLDVGCGYGVLGERLKSRGNYVVGIDLNRRAVAVAATRYDEAHVADVTQIDTLPISLEQHFDVIIFTDVLEHLYDPVRVLDDYRRLLTDDGYIIVSIPNVAAWNVRLALLFGQWNYRETGVLDKTHIRFLTRKTAKRMIEQSGYRVVDMDITPGVVRVLHPVVRWCFNRRGDRRDDPGAIANSAAYRWYRRWVYPLESAIARCCSGLLAFQFVFKAQAQCKEASEQGHASTDYRRSRVHRKPSVRCPVAAG